MPRFTELRVGQRSHALALDVYRLQLRCAAIAVPANVAEGTKRSTRPDFKRFLNIAEGSVAEAEALLRLAGDLRPEFSFESPFDRLIDESEQISRMRHALRSSL